MNIDTKPNHDDMGIHPTDLTGVFELPDRHAPFPLEFADFSPDLPPDVSDRTTHPRQVMHHSSHRPNTLNHANHTSNSPSVTIKDGKLPLETMGTANFSIHQQTEHLRQISEMSKTMSALQSQMADLVQRCCGSGLVASGPPQTSPLPPTTNGIVVPNLNFPQLSPTRARSVLGPNQAQDVAVVSPQCQKTCSTANQKQEPPHTSPTLSPLPSETNPSALQSTKKRKSSNPAPGEKRVKFDWNTIECHHFENETEAKIWLEQDSHPTLFALDSNDTNHFKVKTFGCRKEGNVKNRDRCLAQMKLPLDGKSKVQMKLRVDESCPWCPKNKSKAKRRVPTIIKKATEAVFKEHPHRKPEVLWHHVHRKLETEKDLKHLMNDPSEHASLKKQVKNRIDKLGKESRNDCENFPQTKVNSTGDLQRIRDSFLFKLPNKSVKIPDKLEDASKLLWEKGYLKVNTETMTDNHDPLQTAQKLFTVLDGTPDESESDQISEAERRLYKRIDFLAKGKNPWVFVVCFSSLALLWNLKQCESLGFKVTAAADGTHGTTSNGEILLTFGCFDVKAAENVRSFRPFIYTLCEVENELHFSICVVTLLKYARRLFNLRDFDFHGMLVSDRAEAFVNTFKNAFPRSKTAQCYSHLIRKFSGNQSKGGGNGTYRSDYDSKNGAHDKFPNSFYKDVQNLHGCLTKPMFRRMWELVKAAWEKDGGMDVILRKFEKSYIKDDSYNNWFVGASGIVCCYGCNNPQEVSFRIMKGAGQTEGTCDVGKDVPTMLQKEFPKAVHIESAQASVRRQLTIERANLRDESSKLYKLALEYATHYCEELDVKKINGCHYMNTCFSLEERPLEFNVKRKNPKNNGDRNGDDVVTREKLKEPHEMDSDHQRKEWKGLLPHTDVIDHRYVSTERIELYENALNGETCFKDPVDRKFFSRSVWSLCKVEKRDENGVTRYSCSCAYFLKKGYCPHAALVRGRNEIGEKWLKDMNHKVNGSTKPTPHQLKMEALNKLRHYVSRSLVYLKRSARNFDLLIGCHWETMTKTIQSMVDKLEHLGRDVLFCSEPVQLNSAKWEKLQTAASESLILSTHSIELSLDAHRLNKGCRTRKRNRVVGKDILSTIEGHLTSCQSHVFNIHEDCQSAVGSNRTLKR